jgi:hypothetical protein
VTCNSVVYGLLVVFAAGCGGSDSGDAAAAGAGGGGATGGPSAGKPSVAGAGPQGGAADAEGGADGQAGTGVAGTAAGAATGGTAMVTPLSDHELFLVGVWRGTVSVEDDEYSYFVLQSDRTGCGWDRHGTNFGQRFFAYEFSNWHLEEQPLDAEGRMTIRFTAAAGDVQDIERYDAVTDRIFVGGYQATAWLDLLIPCDSVGTNATATDVMRQGSAPD